MEKIIFYKNFIKRIFLLFVLSSIVLCSSCSKKEEVVFSFEDKTISSSIYTCYYEKVKESMLQTYKSYYATYSDSFKAAFGFLPDGTEEYWNIKFWDEKPTGSDKTIKQILIDNTERACKEYLVYEKIASDYNYSGLPESLTSQFEALKQQNIDKYGSHEAWTIATIGQYGITADELMKLSTVSSYGTVLPQFIFGSKGEKISDEKALSALSNSVQFMYSVYFFQDEEVSEDLNNSSEEKNDESDTDDTSSTDTDVTNSSDDIEAYDSSSDVEDDDSSDDSDTSADKPSEKPPLTIKDYNEHYKNQMKLNYESVIKGEKTFEEVYKDSDDYSYVSKNSPNGMVLNKNDFNKYFSIDCESYKNGDIVFLENKDGVFLIKFVDFTSDYINLQKSNLINSMFDEILESYFEKINVNEDLLSSLINNMK